MIWGPHIHESAFSRMAESRSFPTNSATEPLPPSLHSLTMNDSSEKLPKIRPFSTPSAPSTLSSGWSAETSTTKRFSATRSSSRTTSSTRTENRTSRYRSTAASWRSCRSKKSAPWFWPRWSRSLRTNSARRSRMQSSQCQRILTTRSGQQQRMQE